MANKPIIFSGEMVNAILAGKKNMTRRVIKPQPNAGSIRFMNVYDGYAYFKCDAWPPEFKLKLPYKPDDVLWCRETWASCSTLTNTNDYTYRADCDSQIIKWRPSIHMPRAAARILLRVTDIHVERLQDITDADAHAEGMDSPSYPIVQFKDLWNDLNEKRGYGWDTNPWVWVITFKREG